MEERLFSEILRDEMWKRNISQRQLAIKSGLTEASISKYCSGLRTPETKVLTIICKTLGIKSDVLLGLDVDKSSFDQIKASIASVKSELTFQQKMELIQLISQ